MKRKFVILIATAASVLILAALVFPATRWRVRVLAMKAGGGLDTVGWSQLIRMMRPDSGISLGELAVSGNPFTVIRNPLTSEKDKGRGKELFDRRCTSCHGDGATGGEGPALVGREFTHGDSDWALFLSISKGVPATSMLPGGLPDDDVWRVITYLRDLEGRTRAGSLPADEHRDGIAPARDTTYGMLRNAAAEPGDWLLPSGTYDSQRFSGDDQINKQNVWQLGVQWIHQFGTKEASIETIPIVTGDRMYVTLPTGTVMALDARTGEQIWKYDRTLPGDLVLCCAQNRGVAVLDSRVYVGTLDAHLIALDASTGRLVWDHAVARYREGYSITAAPLVLDDLIVTGVAGGDFPTRGFISAHDPDTGAERWRFKAIPEPGEPGNDTWRGDSWRTGGVATWMTGSFDPELNLIYWGTGNPAPNFNAHYRQGDNLYSNCVVALDASTGKLVWYFQFSPGDDHDWDSVQTPILIDAEENGAMRKLLVVANRNGFFYVLDRRTGQFIRALPYVKQTWAIGLTPAGRPIKDPHASLSPRGTLVYPGMSGGTNASKSAYSRLTQLYYVPALERGGMFFLGEEQPQPRLDQQFWGSGVEPVRDAPHYTALRAIDPATAKFRWEHRRPLRFTFTGSVGGILATAGGLVFASDTSKFFALDADNGKLLLTIETGGKVSGAPVSYRSRGRQYIAVAAGDVLLAFGLPQSVPHP